MKRRVIFRPSLPETRITYACNRHPFRKMCLWISIKNLYTAFKLLFASAILFIMLQNRGINFCAMRIHESYSTFSSSPEHQSIQMTLYKHGILPNSLGELFLKIRGDTNFDCCFKNSSSYFNTPMDHRGCAYLNSYVRFSLKHFVCFRYFAQDIVINFSRKN